MKLNGTRQFISDADAVMYSGVNTARAAAATMRERMRFVTTASLVLAVWFDAHRSAGRVPRVGLRNSAEARAGDDRTARMHAAGCVDPHSAVSRDTFRLRILTEPA